MQRSLQTLVNHPVTGNKHAPYHSFTTGVRLDRTHYHGRNESFEDRLLRLLTCLVLACFSFCRAPLSAESVVDEIIFANEDSESSHKLTATASEVTDGALDRKVRRLLPPEEESWRGGRLEFEMKVQPDEPNYVTAKFWGSDLTGEHSRLMLFMDGKQIGQRHLGEVDTLDNVDDDPRFPGRFFYKTLPLPVHMTEGKRRVTLAIEAQGPIWGYGPTFERFQHVMKEPSRGLYRLATHTDPYFTPAADEPQGDASIEFPVRSEPGEEVFDRLKERVNGEIGKLLRDRNAIGQDALHVLAKAWLTPWTDAYENDDAVRVIVRGIDKSVREFEDDPQSIEKEWHGVGPSADAVRMLAEVIEPYLDEPGEGLNSNRRESWGRCFEASRDWHVKNRRSYTNQTMIVDMNIFRCNRALTLMNWPNAWPEDRTIRLLHEAAGIEPWSGSLDDQFAPTWPLGRGYMQLTKEGLTKELGYVGAYGEIVVGMTRSMYDASRPSPNEDGDPQLKKQLAKLTLARSYFRYPLPDGDGYRAMRLEGNIGWRDWHVPSAIAYAQMPTGDGGPFDVAVATGDRELIGFCQQMLEDNQFFAAVDTLIDRRGWGGMASLLRIPENYEAIKNSPKQTARLPMSNGEPDFVFADPIDGVVAAKHGDNILYASLYWRARYAVNSLARVHFITPGIERDATVRTTAKFRAGDGFYTIPDYTNQPFSKKHEGGYKDEGMSLGMADQHQPIAVVPSYFDDFKPGKENLYAGRASFHMLEYGPYCIAMNCYPTRRFTLELPDAFVGAINVATGKPIRGDQVRLEAEETVVLYNGNDARR